jgi:Holliday junction resolvasome RuvABC endonuclease subunit
MLILPPHSASEVNIVGIDPGTTHLGISVLMVDIVTAKIIRSTAFTLNGSKLLGSDSWISQIHSDRFGRILELEKSIVNVFKYYKPVIVCAESPFFGLRHPNAFAALTEVLDAIRRAVLTYDVWLQLHLAPPSSVKNAVSAGGAATKTTMKEKILNLTELNYNGDVPLHLLDEHSIDALAIGFYMYKQLIQGD